VIVLSLDLDIGSLHCCSKHIAASYETVGEIIEKLIRLGLDYDDLVKIRGILQHSWIKLLRIIRAHEEQNYLFETVARIIDTTRRVRAALHNFLYDMLLSKWDEPTFIEFLKAIGNLYNAEIHLVDYLVEVLEKVMKDEREETIKRKEEAKA